MAKLYKPETKIFYGPLDSDHRLIPAPDINIGLEFNYSNDTIIGYVYKVELSGYATGLDLRELNYGDEIPEPQNYNTGSVIDHLHKLRNILTQNGNILHIVKGEDNSHILKAKGGILRSFNTDESPNNWVQYVAYKAVLEFNSIDFNNSTEDCSNIFLDPSTFNTDGIVDISKFKIKTFSDSWSITFDENESFNKTKLNDMSIDLNIDNNSFNIQYNISATGKHFFQYSDEETSESKLLPAWEQAKNFVQYRLYNQVTSLINGVLKDSYADSCSSSDGLNDILQPNSGSGLLKSFNGYKIFNEQISCETSEAEGTFSATYSAIVKTQNGDSSWSSGDAKHTVRKSITTTNNIGNKITNISLNGTIEGLIEGGIIRTNQPLQLPQNGSFLIFNGTGTNKYNSAKNLLDKIYNENDYNNGLGEFGKRDIKAQFKEALGINATELNSGISNDPNIADPPHPINFNLTHDYNSGTINYSIEYSSNNKCGRKFNEISVQITNPTKVYAVFNIPNSYNCPLIQELGTYTAKNVTLTIQGIDFSEDGQPTQLDLLTEISKDLNLDCFAEGYLPVQLPPNNSYIVTQKQYTRNPMDGSFNITISYTCSQGCLI